MPVILRNRAAGLNELMDNPECDLQELRATYDQFGTVNKLLGGWAGIYRKWIRPALRAADGKLSLLDIGCGGGDVLRMLHQFAEKDQLDVEFTGIDPDPRAIDYLSSQEWPENFHFINVDSSDLVSHKRTFTVVISNHLLHHLSHPGLEMVCGDADLLGQKLVLFSDIERSDIGYFFFSSFAPLIFRNSFIARDGMTSIRRSYRKNELEPLLPEGWVVKRQFPYRLLAIHKKPGHE